MGDDWGEPIALDKVKLTSEAPLASAYNPNGSIESEVCSSTISSNALFEIYRVCCFLWANKTMR